MNNKKGKFSPERLYKIRRLRKARRLYKQQPMMAYQILKEEYPLYTHDEFWNDLKPRSKRKKKKGKSFLAAYGRYHKIQQLINAYLTTGNADYALKAQLLRKYITKPYRMLSLIGGYAIENWFSPFIPHEAIDCLSKQVKKCTTVEEVEKTVEQFRKTYSSPR